MKVNDWEGKPAKFLTDVFDGDAPDIIRCLGGSKVVMEIGFGNSRLLPKILNFTSAKYYGFDKTCKFVSRAKDQFKRDRVKFYQLDIENLTKLTKVIRKVNPDTLILRYILDHVPEWKKSLRRINVLGIPTILISIHTPPTKRKSWTAFNSHKYTMNFISPNDLNAILGLYKLTVFKEYEGVDNTFRVYNKIVQ